MQREQASALLGSGAESRQPSLFSGQKKKKWTLLTFKKQQLTPKKASRDMGSVVSAPEAVAPLVPEEEEEEEEEEAAAAAASPSPKRRAVAVFEQIKNFEPALIRGLLLQQPPQVVNLLCRVPAPVPSPAESVTVRSIREVCRDVNFQKEHQRLFPRIYRIEAEEEFVYSSATMILNATEYALSYPAGRTQGILVFDMYKVVAERAETDVVYFNPIVEIDRQPHPPPIGKVIGNFPNSHRFLCVGENLTAVVFDIDTGTQRQLLQTAPFPIDVTTLRMWAVGDGSEDTFIVKAANIGRFYVSDGRTVQSVPLLFEAIDLQNRFELHMQHTLRKEASLSIVSSASGTHVYMTGFARWLHRWTLDFSALRFLRYDGVVDRMSHLIHDAVPVALTLRNAQTEAFHIVIELGKAGSGLIIRQPRDAQREIGYFFEVVETEGRKEIYYYRSEDFRRDLGEHVVKLASGATATLAKKPPAYSPDPETHILPGMSPVGSDLVTHLPALEADDAAISVSVTPSGGDALVMVIPRTIESAFSRMLHMRPVLLHLQVADDFRFKFFDAPTSLLEFMTVRPPVALDLAVSVVLAPDANRYFVMQSVTEATLRVEVYAGRLAEPV